MVKMTATDTLHISAVQDKPILAGEAFEVSEADAASLEKRGLATRAAEAKSDKAKAKK